MKCLPSYGRQVFFYLCARQQMVALQDNTWRYYTQLTLAVVQLLHEWLSLHVHACKHTPHHAVPWGPISAPTTLTIAPWKSFRAVY